MQKAKFTSLLAAVAFQAAFGGRLFRVSSKAYFVVWECVQ